VRSPKTFSAGALEFVNSDFYKYAGPDGLGNPERILIIQPSVANGYAG